MLNSSPTAHRTASTQSAPKRIASAAWVATGLIAFSIVAAAVIVALPRNPASDGSPSTPASAPSQSQPSALSEAEARSIARGHVVPEATYLSTRSGRFGDIYSDRRAVIEEALSNRTVWAVTFSSMFDICPPDGSACEKRPGTTTVYLDFYTGEWLRTSAFSPQT